MKGIKKAGILSITLLFLAMSVGVGFRVHYCHGDVSSAAYFSAEPSCDCTYEMSEADCCSTISQYIVLDDDRIPASAIKTYLNQSPAILNSERTYHIECPILFREESNTAGYYPTATRYILYHSLIYYS